jgi:hypothetical protein
MNGTLPPPCPDSEAARFLNLIPTLPLSMAVHDVAVSATKINNKMLFFILLICEYCDLPNE